MNTKFTTLNLFFSPEKEEAWLQRMAQQGWFLNKVSVFNTYTFEQGGPENRAYKLDYRYFSSPRDRDDYLALFVDSGWQPVMPREVNGAFYFTNRQEEALQDIFSDEVSRAQRNLRYASLSAYSLVIAFLPLLVLYLTGNFRLSDIGYLTPGLWEMTRSEFFFHFLFETPFVVLRATMYFLPLVPIALVLFFLLRYYLVYRKALREQAV